jgi:hypothetical protein
MDINDTNDGLPTGVLPSYPHAKFTMGKYKKWASKKRE